MSPHYLAPEPARADLCRFLAACYYEPAPEFGEERLFDSLRAAAGALDPEWAAAAERLGAAFAGTALDDLRVDYTRLFIGPSQALAQPYGSIWLESAPGLMQDSTVAVADFYRSAGFEVAEDLLDLPDHIAVELEFLYLLIFRENQALAANDAAAGAAAAATRQQFLAQHLARWIEPFTAALRSGADTEFYRLLADLTAAFVLREDGRGYEAPALSGA